jgi:hypothetical protein
VRRATSPQRRANLGASRRASNRDEADTRRAKPPKISAGEHRVCHVGEERSDDSRYRDDHGDPEQDRVVLGLCLLVEQRSFGLVSSANRVP